MRIHRRDRLKARVMFVSARAYPRSTTGSSKHIVELLPWNWQLQLKLRAAA
jgi:hypothetical protein